MVMFIKVKDGKRCRAKMQAMWPGGVIMAFEDQCRLPIGHEGPHRGKDTHAVWDNADRRLTRSDPTKPKIFLAK